MVAALIELQPVPFQASAQSPIGLSQRDCCFASRRGQSHSKRALRQRPRRAGLECADHSRLPGRRDDSVIQGSYRTQFTQVPGRDAARRAGPEHWVGFSAERPHGLLDVLQKSQAETCALALSTLPFRIAELSAARSVIHYDPISPCADGRLEISEGGLAGDKVFPDLLPRMRIPKKMRK